MSNREGGVEVLLVNLVLVVRRLRESPVSCTYFDVGTAGADVFFSFFLSFFSHSFGVHFPRPSTFYFRVFLLLLLLLLLCFSSVFLTPEVEANVGEVPGDAAFHTEWQSRTVQ